MSRATDPTSLSSSLASLNLDRTVTIKPQPSEIPAPPSPPSTPSTAELPISRAVVFPSHVRTQFRRNPTDYTADLVRLLDDISTVTHSISTYVSQHEHTAPLLAADRRGVDPDVATQRLYGSLSHDGYACVILERSYEQPLTFHHSALHGCYVVMLTSLDVDPAAEEHAVCGTLFSVYKRLSETSLPGRLKDLQQCLGDQVAAGYVVYSSAIKLYYTLGNGVFSFCLHPVASQYFLSPERPLQLVEGCDVYTDYDRLRRDDELGQAVRAVVRENSGTVYDSGCFVADFDGAVRCGGLVVWYGVHLLCEGAPLAWLVEQLGGVAVDGEGKRILNHAVLDEDVHKKITFLAGPGDMVDAILHKLRA